MPLTSRRRRCCGCGCCAADNRKCLERVGGGGWGRCIQRAERRSLPGKPAPAAPTDIALPRLSGTAPTLLQVRAGTGGEEAALWAADLIRMYQKYADIQVGGCFRGISCTAPALLLPHCSCCTAPAALLASGTMGLANLGVGLPTCRAWGRGCKAAAGRLRRAAAAWRACRARSACPAAAAQQVQACLPLLCASHALLTRPPCMHLACLSSSNTTISCVPNATPVGLTFYLLVLFSLYFLLLVLPLRRAGRCPS